MVGVARCVPRRDDSAPESKGRTEAEADPNHQNLQAVVTVIHEAVVAPMDTRIAGSIFVPFEIKFPIILPKALGQHLY